MWQRKKLEAKEKEIKKDIENWAKKEGILKSGELLTCILKIERRPPVNISIKIRRERLTQVDTNAIQGEDYVKILNLPLSEAQIAIIKALKMDGNKSLTREEISTISERRWYSFVNQLNTLFCRNNMSYRLRSPRRTELYKLYKMKPK